MRITLIVTGILCAMLYTSSAVLAQAESTKPASTLDNLQAAYNGESNAHTRYLAFAKKADEDGYHQVASLFRAAAASEQIHSQNHAKVIESLGATPLADIKIPEVKSTKENLEAAIKGEDYERNTMYPEFIKQAEKEGNGKAKRTFNWALKAETEHSKLYSQALANIESWKEGTKTFLVCSNCGYATDNTTILVCPVCFVPRNKINEIS